MLLAGAQHEAQRQPLAVHHSMNLGRQTATGTSGAVVGVTPNTRAVLMNTHDGAVDHLQVCLFEIGNGLEEAIPNAGASPTDETVIASCVGTILIRQVAPRCAGPQHPEDAVQDTPVINAGDAA